MTTIKFIVKENSLIYLYRCYLVSNNRKEDGKKKLSLDINEAD